jgi:hypothetical protein
MASRNSARRLWVGDNDGQERSRDDSGPLSAVHPYFFPPFGLLSSGVMPHMRMSSAPS